MVRILALLVAVPLAAFGQTPAPALQFLANIPIPNWTPSTASFNSVFFDPPSGVVYVADRLNDGATAVDTKTWTVVGTSVAPGCGIQTLGSSGRPNCYPQFALVTPDSRKLVTTATGPTAANPNAPPAGIWVFDLRSPQTAPSLIQFPLSGLDAVEYDPITHYLYVKTNSAAGATGNTLVIADPVAGKVVGQIPLGFSIEYPKFNPVDGLLYLPETDAGKQALVMLDPSTNTIVGSYPLQSSAGPCTPHEVQIDPVTDIAVVPCTEASVAMDLHSGAIIGTYPLAVDTDISGFNLSLRNFYLAALNGTSASGCPTDSTKDIPVVGVVTTASASPGQFAGLACGGRGQKGGAADPVNQNVYVATAQYPVNSNSSTTGQAGLMVFHDPAALFTALAANTEEASTQAVLAAVGGSGVSGLVTIGLRRRNLFVDAALSRVSAGSTSTGLIITTTAGNETVPCGVNGSGAGYCQGRLYGDPLIAGVVDVTSGGKFVASGQITLVATIPTYVSTDSFGATK